MLIIPLPDNKRLDEWVSEDRLDFKTIEAPAVKEERRPPRPEKKKRKKLSKVEADASSAEPAVGLLF